MFFTPPHIKAAKERARLLKKVYHYRYAALKLEERDALRELWGRFASAIKIKDDKLLAGLTLESDKLLRRVGAHYYKHYHFYENVETLVVAAVLAIGIRMYFLQPFKIPTNSMWPTYHGMTYTLEENQKTDKGAIGDFIDLTLRGITHYQAVAPVSGRVSIPLLGYEDRERYKTAFPFRVVSRKLLGIFPIKERQYIFYVDDKPVALHVPLEFNFDKVLLEKYFHGGVTVEPSKTGRFDTGISVSAGDKIISFSIETGDMLFVDRVSYHFTSPKVGEPIVFRTRNVEGLTRLNQGIPDDKYYIKRLVALGGDLLEVKAPMLLRNNQPITGSPIFALNNSQTPPYGGDARKRPEGARWNQRSLCDGR